MRELQLEELREFDALVRAGQTAGDIGYRFGLKVADVNALARERMRQNDGVRVPHDADNPEDHPALDVIVQFEGEVVHLWQSPTPPNVNNAHLVLSAEHLLRIAALVEETPR